MRLQGKLVHIIKKHTGCYFRRSLGKPVFTMGTDSFNIVKMYESTDTCSTKISSIIL